MTAGVRRQLIPAIVAFLAFTVLVGLLYYRPLHDYFDARSQQAAQLTAV